MSASLRIQKNSPFTASRSGRAIAFFIGGPGCPAASDGGYGPPAGHCRGGCCRAHQRGPAGLRLIRKPFQKAAQCEAISQLHGEGICLQLAPAADRSCQYLDEGYADAAEAFADALEQTGQPVGKQPRDIAEPDAAAEGHGQYDEPEHRSKGKLPDNQQTREAEDVGRQHHVQDGVSVGDVAQLVCDDGFHRVVVQLQRPLGDADAAPEAAPFTCWPGRL